MGDLVRSEQTTFTERLHAHFNEAVEQQNDSRAEALVSPLTITLGDEFQGLVTSLVTAAHIAREIRFHLMSHAIDCRFAIGVATLRTPLNTQRAWNMMGPGFADTRARLNEKRSNTFYRFVFPEQPVLESLLEASGAGLTAIEQSWTETQRTDIWALLRGASPAEVAKGRNVSVHNVYKVRSSGNYDLYLLHWNAIEKALTDLDKNFAMGRER